MIELRKLARLALTYGSCDLRLSTAANMVRPFQRRRFALLSIVAFLVTTHVASAQNETRETFQSTPRDFPGAGEALNFINNDTGELDINGAKQLVTALVNTLLTPEQQESPGRDLFIVHTLVWNSSADNKPPLKIDKQHWYVLETNNAQWGDDDFAKNNRVFGYRRLWFLYVHLKVPKEYKVNYTLHAVHKSAAFLVHLGQVLGVALVPVNSTAAAGNNYWDAYHFGDVPLPSDMDISGEVVPTSGDTTPVTIDKQTFDNEGRYHIDFSIGVPIVKLSELSYVSASNTLVPAKVARENLFGLFNYYFQTVDIKASGFSWWPHAVAGVGLGSRPLQKALVGVGWGPTLANFYFGLLLNTQRLPQGSACGDSLPSPLPTATVLKNKTCPQFGFGLNISAGSILDSLKKK